MIFHSLEFLVFFPLVALVFHSTPRQFRWLVLLAASYWYYISWRPKHILLLIAVTLVSYFTALLLQKNARPNLRRSIFILGIAGSLGALLLFKYFNFFSQSLQSVLQQLGASVSLPMLYYALPIGISFYTLQAVGYIIDVYRGTQQAEKHPGIHALFLSFFPQVLSGPIARANQLLPQLHEFRSADYEEIVGGLLRMAWGFFKKLVIADRLAVIVNAVYGDPGSFAGLPLILATYAFAFQIYFDFSGYADIAIGAARVLGIQLVENFQQPYLATSIPDFWRRWHISLSNWLRDYIFYPLSRSLARSRYGSGSWLNLILPPLVTMGISGLWHGANWTFVIWGLLHGVFMIVAVLMNRFKPFTQAMSRLPGWASTGLQVLVTFHLVLLTWIFFRANSIADAFYILSHLFVDLKGQTPVLELFGGSYQLWIALAALLTLTCIHWLGGADGNIRAFALRQPLWLRWLGYYVLVVCILMFGKLGTTEFIYLQF